MAVPVLQVTASVVIALLVLRVLQHALSDSQNPIASGIEGGLSFLLGS